MRRQALLMTAPNTSVEENKQRINHQQVLIIGAGPAGLMAAYYAAKGGAQVTLLEKMMTPARKLLITGAGSCNLTASGDLDNFIEHYFENGPFLYPAFHNFFRSELLSLLHTQAVLTQVKENGKYFPSSGKATDILDALLALCDREGVKIIINAAVKEIITKHDRIQGVLCHNGCFFPASALVLATGGNSYPKTGSSGDGYLLAEACGHTITPTLPALVPLIIKDKRLHELRGISVAAAVSLVASKQKLAHASGQLLFTHFGLSGPVILRLSRYYGRKNFAGGKEDKGNTYKLLIDLVPEMNRVELTHLWQKNIKENINKKIINALAAPFPYKLLSFLLSYSKIDCNLKAHNLSSAELATLVNNCKKLELPIEKTRGFREAMVTTGGVSIKQVNPQDLQSRLISGLFFAGEVLDIDGDTGGYNLQAAFSTGVLAGSKAAKFLLSKS